MKLKLFFLFGGLIVVIIVGYMGKLFISGFYFSDNRKLETTISPKISPPVGQTIPKEAISAQVEDDHLYAYNGKTARRAAGKFLKLSAVGSLATLTVDVNGKKSAFILNKDTVMVCQPTGSLSTSGEEQIAANDVFIDDKRMDNSGIPWGIQIPRDQLSWRVKSGSYTQIFYLNEPKLVEIPNVVYVWFKTCE